MCTIFYNDKVITSDNSYKYNDSTVKTTTAEPFFFSSAQILLEKLEQFDVIIVDKSYEDRLIESLESIFKPITAAGGVVVNPQNQILMIFRNGKWDLPKGKKEKGEDIELCAMREVEEECGIGSLMLGTLRDRTYHIYPLKEKYVIKTTYWYNMSYSGDDTLTPQTEEGITSVEWVDECQIPEKLQNSYQTIAILLSDKTNTK